MDAAKLLSSSTVVSAPSLPPRGVGAVESSSTKVSSFPAPRSLSLTMTQRKAAAMPVLVPAPRQLKCAAAGSGGGGNIAEIGESQFADLVLRSDGPVLVEFVANWCGPCRLISPAIEWVAQEYKDRLTVVKIDHDANPKLIQDYKVYGLPALIVFKNGKEVPESRREGAITKTKLKEYLDALLDSISVA